MFKHSPLTAFGLCALSLGGLTISSVASAQEQENPSTPGQIPDPSTYQGSTVLQQQSDQQDQNYRQQQQQQSGQQQYQGNSGSYGGSYGQSQRPDPATQCFAMLQRSTTLARLRGLVELGVNTRDPRYFTIDRRPTAPEKPVLLRWLAGRRHCPLGQWQSVAVTRANAIASQITNELIVALSQGRFTYGEFNYRRAQNTENFLRYRDSH